MAKTPNTDDTTPQDSAPEDGAPQNCAPEDGAPQDGAPQNGTRQNETPPDETVHAETAHAQTPSAENLPQPTEQLPLEPAPRSATDSASGGATGLPAKQEARESLFRRHPLGTAIAGGAIAVVLVSGLTAWGVGAAVTASLTSSTSAEMPMGMATTAPTTAPSTGKAQTAGRIAFRATIKSMGSDSWTILTKKGKTVTVAVDNSTQFGTKKATASAGSFAVGDSVVVVAMRGTDGTPTASRIAQLPAATDDATTGS